MSLHLGFKKYDDDQSFYIVNWADKSPYLNSADNLPEAIRELRSQSLQLLLGHARKEGEQVVKIASGHNPPKNQIKGYATFLSGIKGCDLSQLEGRLGFKKGALTSCGAYCYKIDVSSLNVRNIAPRGTTSWPGGISPRELENYSKKVGVDLETHRDYPPADIPVIQFCILEDVDIVGTPRYLNYDDVI